MTTLTLVRKLAKLLGGKVVEVLGPFPDGTGATVVSLPLPSDHWLTRPRTDYFYEAPPMPMRMGTADPRRKEFAAALTAAGRYALRSATACGTRDYDPDAVIQNLVVGMLGYNTPDGLSPNEWANPSPASR